ncbi:MAG: hypothetical protein WDN00_11545 [Limisphaerales bacterium]
MPLLHKLKFCLTALLKGFGKLFLGLYGCLFVITLCLSRVSQAEDVYNSGFFYDQFPLTLLPGSALKRWGRFFTNNKRMLKKLGVSAVFFPAPPIRMLNTGRTISCIRCLIMNPTDRNIAGSFFSCGAMLAGRNRMMTT